MQAILPPDYQYASSSLTTLPHYSPSDEAPRYAPEPSEDERRLDYVARVNDVRVPESLLTKKLKNITISFSDQEVDASMPTYARNSSVRGELQIDGEENIISVSVKLEGRQTLSVAESADNVRLLFAHTYTLWKKEDAAMCPSILPFSIPFPVTYKEKGMSVQVPPTFTANYSGVPGLSGQNSYHLSVQITKLRLGSWKQHKTVDLPVRYYPRSRPVLPICTSLHPFFSTVKSAPAEWRQVNSTMQPRDKTLGAVDCHLFIPAVQIYSISDTIPFHLQLRGSAKSLRAFINPPTPSPSPSHRLGLGLRSSRSSSHSSTSLSSRSTVSRFSAFGALPKSAVAQMENSQPVVRVYILRQVSATVNFQKAWRSTVIGEGKLWPLQHVDMDDLLASDDDILFERMQALDWEGEVRCNDDIDVGSFAAGSLVVKDFIVIHLCPPNPRTSPLLEHQHAHSIRLVTDSYRESYDYPVATAD